jgi:GH24 family phage-related lysozyme (muramidase)
MSKNITMRVLYVLSFLIIGIASECSRSRTQINEGTRLCCYYDTKGIPTIGVGFNLLRSDAAAVMAKYNLKLADVLNDCKESKQKACLTNAQATDIFNNNIYPAASQCATTYAPGMPTSVHAALTDVAFAGCGTLNQFIKMKAALDKKQWKTASDELKNSRWCTDVKSTRCGLDVACIASGT